MFFNTSSLPSFLLRSFLVFALLLLLSACSSEAPEEESGEEEESTAQQTLSSPTLQTPRVETITPELRLSGTLNPVSQVTVTTDATGTLQGLSVDIGDTVQSGATLATIQSKDQQAQRNLAEAQSSLSNAQVNLALSQTVASQNEKIAQNAIDQARSALDTALESSDDQDVSIEVQIEAAEAAVAQAQISLDSAIQNREDILESLDLESDQLARNRVNAISTAFITLRSSLEANNALLGTTDETESVNDAYELYLGFDDAQTLIDAENAFTPLWIRFLETESRYTENRSSVSLQETEELLEEVRAQLERTSLLLESTPTNGVTESFLPGLRAENNGNRQAIEGSLQSFSQILTTEESFQLREDQAETQQDIFVSQARTALRQAEISRDQVLASRDSSDTSTSSQITSAQEQLERAQEQLELTIQQSATSLQASRQQVDTATRSVESARAQLALYTVRSPIGGVVIEKSLESGSSVAPGTPVITLATIATLEIELLVPTERLPELSVGTKARVVIPGFDEQEATLTQIVPVADAQSRRATVKLTLPNRDQIPANIFADVYLPLEPISDALMIPRASLQNTAPATVYVTEPPASDRLDDIPEGVVRSQVAQVASREITLGVSIGEDVQVLSGLSPGEGFLLDRVSGVLPGVLIVRSSPVESSEQSEDEDSDESNDEDTSADSESTDSPEEQSDTTETDSDISNFPGL